MSVKKLIRTAVRKLGYDIVRYSDKNITDLQGLDLPLAIMVNSKLLPNRYAALPLLPKGGVAAEIGVAYGDFSRAIINNLSPDVFYAIDTFSHGPGSDFWDRTDFRDANLKQKEFIENKFKKEIDNKSFFIRKGLSWDILNTFADNFFDYIYLDAAHDYDSAKKDIDVLLKKIKHGGIAQFNDYTLYDWNGNQPFGVLKAVDEMLVQGKHEILYLCLQPGGYNDLVIKINKNAV